MAQKPSEANLGLATQVTQRGSIVGNPENVNF